MLKPFSQLRKEANEKQQSSFDPKTGKYAPSTQSEFDKQLLATHESSIDPITRKYAPSTQIELDPNLLVINYFLKVGLDHKGQSQCCYEKKGGGLQVNGSIDPGRILGVFSTELSLSAGLTRSKEILLIAQRGPSKLDVFDVPSPIMINSLVGVSWEGSVGVGLQITVGVKYSVGNEKGAKVEKSWVKKGKDQSKIQLQSMELGFEAEAKAGFAAQAGYKYQHFYAEDVCPLPFADKEEAKQMLGMLFTKGSYKAILKNDAVDFINKDILFYKNKKVKYDGFWGHITTKEIISILSKGFEHPNMALEKKSKALSLIDSLLCWADADQKPSIPTSLRISSHKGDGKAGLIASASVKVNAYVVGAAEAHITAEALTISGAYKSASVRYQTAYYTPYHAPEKAHVIMTQDSKIVYKQIVFTPLSVKAGASFNAPFYSKGVEKEKPLLEPEILNRMTYTTTTVFWSSKAKLFQGLLPKSKKNMTTFSLPVYKGTGISFGGSFELEDLMRFFSFYDSITDEFLDEEVDVYFHSIATSLNVEIKDLVKFFMELKDTDKELILSDLFERNGVKTVLLEASFSVTLGSVDVISTVNGKNELIELAPDTAKKLFEKGANNRKLEAIRIRYRIQDTYNQDSNFTLGFKVLGNGLKINLKKVNQAGSEGIVDLYIVWMNGLTNAGVSSSANYEQAVPAVTLFCQ